MKLADSGCGPLAYGAVRPIVALALFAACALASAQPPVGPSRGTERKLELDKWYVPASKQSEFAPKNEVYVTRSEAELDRLVEQYNARRLLPTMRRPTAGRLRATFDVATGRLSGTATWIIPSGPSAFVKLAPWSLFLSRVAVGTGEASFGLTPAGELLVRVPERESAVVTTDFASSALHLRDRWRCELALPACAVASLEIDLPAGWSLHAIGKTVDRTDEPQRWRLNLAGAAAASFDVRPANAERLADAVTCKSSYIYHIDESGIELEAALQLEALGEPVDRVSLLFDRRLSPLQFEVDAQSAWRYESLRTGEARVVVELRRPQLVPFQVRFRSNLGPLVQGLWRPPYLRVEQAVHRGETVAFAVSRRMRPGGVVPGAYHATAAALASDNYRFEFVRPGPVSDILAWHLLQATDVPEVARLCSRLTRQAAAPGPARRILESMSAAERKAVAHAANAADDSARTAVLAALNGVLRRTDLYRQEDFEGIATNPEVKALLSRRPEERSHPETARLNRLLLEAALPGEILPGRAPMPGILLPDDTGLLEVAERRVVLQLGVDSGQLAARIVWVRASGSPGAPSFWLPAGWEVVSVESETDQRRLSYAARAAGDEGSVYVLQLDSNQAAAQRITASIRAQFKGELGASDSDARLTLPEIRAVDAIERQPYSYTVISAAEATIEPAERPSAEAAPLSLLGVAPGAETRISTFVLSPARRRKTLTIKAQDPALRAVHTHTVRRTKSGWTGVVSFQINVSAGQVPELGLVCNRPLPENLAFALEGVAGPVEIVPESGAGTAGRRYRLRLPAPVGRRAKLTGSWDASGNEVEPPLFDLPAVNDFSAAVYVVSDHGAPISIAATGLAATLPAAQTGEPSQTAVVWSGGYRRLAEGAALRATASPTDSIPIAASQAYLRCHTLIKDETVVHRFLVRIDSPVPRPFAFRMPADARLLGVEQDGQNIVVGLRENTIVFPGALPAGRHWLRIGIEQPLASWWGQPTVKLDPSLVDDAGGLVWQVTFDGGGVAFPGRDLTRLSKTIAQPQDPTANGSSDADRRVALAALNAAHAELADSTFANTGHFLFAMGRQLAAGWLLVIDSAAVDPEEDESSSAADFAGWLERHRLTMLASGRTILITRGARPAASAGTEQGDADWSGSIARQVEEQGIDVGGRFVTPAVLLTQPRMKSELAEGTAACVGKRLFETWVFAANPSEELRLTIVPTLLVRRLSQCLTVVAIVLGGLGARRRSIRDCWRVVGALLGTTVALGFAGGLVDAVFSLPCGVCAATVTVVALCRGVDFQRARLVTSTLAVVAVAGLGSRLDAQEPPTTDRQRVLILYDPAQADRRMNQAILTESLWKRLRETTAGPPHAVLIRRASYRGILDSVAPAKGGATAIPTHIRWQGELDLIADPASQYPQTVSLGFTGVQMSRVLVDGVAAEARPPGNEATLDFQLAKPGVVKLRCEFTTPLLGRASERDVEMVLPPAPDCHVVLALDAQPVQLLDDCEPYGFVVESVAGKSQIEGRFGPARRVRLRWRDAKAAPSATRVTATGVQLFDVDWQTADLFAAYRFECADGATEQLTFALDDNLVVQRVEATGMLQWRVVAADGSAQPGAPSFRRHLVVTLDSPHSGALDVRMRCLVRPDDWLQVKLPRLEPLGVTRDEGVVATRLPPGWKVDPKATRNLEAETAKGYQAAWRELGLSAPPERINLVQRYRQRPIEATMALTPPRAAFEVAQQINLRVEAAAGNATASCQVRLKPTGTNAPLTSVSVRLPPRFELERIAGAGLYQWYQSQGVATLLYERPIEEPVEIGLVGRFQFDSARYEPRKPRNVSVAGFDWPGADAVKTSWNIATAPDWQLGVANPRGIAPVATAVDAPVRSVESTAADHSFQVLLTPVATQTQRRSMTVVTPRTDGITFDGRFEVRVVRGSLTRLEVRAPVSLGEVRWQSDALRLNGTSVVGAERSWVFQAAPPVPAVMRLSWQAKLPIANHPVSLPRVRLIGEAMAEEWVAWPRDGDGTLTLVESVGLTSRPPPENVATWSGGRPPDSARLEYFQATTDAWSARVRVPAAATATEATRVIAATLDLSETNDGRIVATSSWTVASAAAAVAEFEIPDGCLVRSVRLRGNNVTEPESTPGRLRFPLFRGVLPAEVAVDWSATAEPGRRAVAVPRLLGAADTPCLVRIRLPAGRRAQVAGAPLPRAGWLARRYRSAIDRLAEAMEVRRTLGGVETTALLELAARCNALEKLTQEAVEMAAGNANHDKTPVDVGALASELAASVARHDELQTEAQAAGLFGADPTVAAAVPVVPLVLEGSARTEYFQADREAAEIGLRSHWSWRPLMFDLDCLVRLVTALVVLAVTWSPRLQPVLRLYWPAVAAMMGAAWFHWTGLPELGLIGISFAMVGTWWTIRRWLADAQPVATIAEGITGFFDVSASRRGDPAG